MANRESHVVLLFPIFPGGEAKEGVNTFFASFIVHKKSEIFVFCIWYLGFNSDQLVDALEVGRRELLVGLMVSAFKHWQVPMSVPAEIQGILWESGH